MTDPIKLLDLKIEAFRKAAATGSKAVPAQRAWLEGYLKGLQVSKTISTEDSGRMLGLLVTIEDRAVRKRKVQ